MLERNSNLQDSAQVFQESPEVYFKESFNDMKWLMVFSQK